MSAKRYVRATVREALAAAREDLGPAAVVQSTELVPAPGWRGWVGHRMVSVTAVADRPVSPERPLVPAGRQPVAGAARHGVVARLTAAGLDAALAESTASQLSDAECRAPSEQRLQRALASEMAALVSEDEDYARYEVFVGPPGVGKTTTIAKIAAQARAAHGRTLGMVAADAFRAGAIEHLRSYATIIGSPLRVARTAAELDTALTATRHAVLVDTAGRAPSDDGFRTLLDVIGRRRHVRTHLVIAADTSAATARKIFDRYAPARPSRVVITKIDEAESVTPLLRVVRERQIPVSYVTDGQRVPEDLERARPAWLAAALLNGLHQEAMSWP